MATPVISGLRSPSAAPTFPGRMPAGLAPWLLTPVALFIHGYHPFAGDAGLYTAGIRHILDPSLYPLNAAFVDAFTRRSLFAWAVAALVRITHAPLAWTLLSLHLLSVILFLIACSGLAARLFAAESVRWCSVLLAGACCSLPVAGTALALMDPYVTARSFSTPLGLLAVAACIDRAAIRTVLLLALAALFHPLMGCYAIAFVMLLVLVSSGHIRAAIGLCSAGFVLAGIAFAIAHRLPGSAAYREAIDLPQRGFLFLARWHWHEVLGLICPLALYAIGLRRAPRSSSVGKLCLAAVLLGTTSLLIATLFVPPAGPWLLVPLQPLRAFHLLYVVGVVLCGGVLHALFERRRPLAAAVVLVLFAGMAIVEGVNWPGCSRIEWPDAQPANAYEQAFLWIHSHTPRNAVFAFDPQFVYWPDEDEEGFRALTERDALADDKDAGVVTVIPGLASRWAAQRNAASAIDNISDERRQASLAPFGVNWVLLPTSTTTHLPCPFHNRAVQVCDLPRPDSP